MRRILIENARRKQRQKRGGGRRRVDLDEARPRPIADRADELLALDEALDQPRRARIPQAAELVKLRFFAGLPVEEAAEIVGDLSAPPPTALGLRPGLATPLLSATARTAQSETENSCPFSGTNSVPMAH